MPAAKPDTATGAETPAAAPAAPRTAPTPIYSRVFRPDLCPACRAIVNDHNPCPHFIGTVPVMAGVARLAPLQAGRVVLARAHAMPFADAHGIRRPAAASPWWVYHLPDRFAR